MIAKKLYDRIRLHQSSCMLSYLFRTSLDMFNVDKKNMLGHDRNSKDSKAHFCLNDYVKM